MVSLRSVLLASTAAASFIAAPAFAQEVISVEGTAPSLMAQTSEEMGMMAMTVSGTVRNVDEDFGEIRVDREDTGTLEVIYVGQEDVATLKEGDMVDLVIRDGNVIAISESESGMMMAVNTGPIGEPTAAPMSMFVSATVREIDPDFGTIRVDREDTSGLEVINVGSSEIAGLSLNPGDDISLLISDDTIVAIMADDGMMMSVNPGITMSEMESDGESELDEPTETEMTDGPSTQNELEAQGESEMDSDMGMDSDMDSDMGMDSEMDSDMDSEMEMGSEMDSEMDSDMEMESEMEMDSDMGMESEMEMESTTTTTTTTTQPTVTTTQPAATTQPVRGLW